MRPSGAPAKGRPRMSALSWCMSDTSRAAADEDFKTGPLPAGFIVVDVDVRSATAVSHVVDGTALRRWWHTLTTSGCARPGARDRPDRWLKLFGAAYVLASASASYVEIARRLGDGDSSPRGLELHGARARPLPRGARRAGLSLRSPTRGRTARRGTRRRTARGRPARAARTRSPKSVMSSTNASSSPSSTAAIASSVENSTRPASLSESEMQWILAVARPRSSTTGADLLRLGDLAPVEIGLVGGEVGHDEADAVDRRCGRAADRCAAAARAG